MKLKGNGKYTLFLRVKNDFGIKIEYGINDSVFEPLEFNKKICEGIVKSEKEITLYLKFLAPFNLPPNKYLIELYFILEGNVMLEIKDKINEYSEKFNKSNIMLNYSLKARMKAGEKIKVKGKAIISGGELKKGIIKLRLPYEIAYEENSFYFNGINILPSFKDNEFLFEIKNILPGIYDFEYTIFAKSWTEPKIVFIEMGMEGWIDEEYIKSPEVIQYVYLEADIFYEGGIILGRVYDKEKSGVEGVTIFLEDGTKVKTDKDGKYSFRYVKPGTHIISLKNYKKIVEVPPGGIYLLDFEIEQNRIGPKREYIFLSLGEVQIKGIKDVKSFEGIETYGKLNLYFLGELEGGILIEALLNTAGKKPSEIGYLIKPEEKYKVFADNSFFEGTSPGKFYVMIKKGEEYFNAGFVKIKDGLLDSKKEMIGTAIKKKLGAINLFGCVGFPNYSFHQEEFLVSSSIPHYKLKREMIIINSERVYLETRDILDPKIVLKSRLLIRDKDYSFDYKNGEIWLSSHILEEISINPIFIVVKYECYSSLKEMKDINWRLRKELTLPNICFGINLDRSGSTTSPYNSISIDESINYKIFNLSSQYSHRIEKVKNGNGYRINFNIKLYKSKIEIMREYRGEGIELPYPAHIPMNREKNSIKGDIDLCFYGFYLAPCITTFREEKDKIIREGIRKEVEFGWRSPFYNQRVFTKFSHTKIDDEDHWYTGIGYSRKGFSFLPFYHWSEKQRFIGGLLEIGRAEKIKFNLEKEYGFGLYYKNLIGLEKYGLNGRFFSRQRIIYENRMIDNRDYIGAIYETNFFIEPIFINTSFDYRKYFKIKEETQLFFYRLILWPLNDLSLFSQTNLLNKKFKLFESGFAYRPLWQRSIAILGMVKYEGYRVGALDFAFSPFNQVKIFLGNAFGKNLKYHNLRFEIIPFLNIGIGISFGLKNDERLFGGEIFYEFLSMRFSTGYNYSDYNEVKKGFYIKLIGTLAKHWAFGIEENALEMLDKFIIKVPSVVTIGEEFKVKIIALDKKGEIFKDFIGDIELMTKTLKKRVRFTYEDKGEKAFKFIISDPKELGPNYILIKDRKGRLSKAFFYLKEKDEIISYEEVMPYIPEEPEFFSHFIINVPKYARVNEPFIVEIIAISNKNRVFESFTEEIEILTSNKEKVKPNKFYFTPLDKGKLKVTLTYPGKERIRLLVRPVKEPLKVSISEPIIFREK